MAEVAIKITRNEVLLRMAWPLEMKLRHFAKQFAEFMIEYDGHCYDSFSGGKDSQVGGDIIDKIYSGEFAHLLPVHIYNKLLNLPRPPRVFCNTGNEFPEIVRHVKQYDNVVILKPAMGFTKVFATYGVALGSKKIAATVRRLKDYIENPCPKNAATRKLYLTGIKRDGTKSKSWKLADRWVKLLDAPFKVSDQCCKVFKKDPFKKYQKETGRMPIYYTTVMESDQRWHAYMQTGCNSYSEGKEACRPLSIFTDKDIWEYHGKYNLRFAEVYYDRTVLVEQLDGSYKARELKAECRTGCVACGFGLHLESKEENNRFQRLAISHPKFHQIVIKKLGWGEILDWMQIPYQPKKEYTQLDLFN